MDQEQETHIERIIQSEAHQLSVKYRIGQAEHGGSLWKKSGIIKNLNDEKTDFVVYTHVLEEQLRHVENLLLAGQPMEALKWVSAMLSDKTEEVVDS